MITSLFADSVVPPAETHSGPSQACKMNLFAISGNNFKLTLLTIFAKITFTNVDV